MKTLGLLPSQVVYVEGKYNQVVNDFIQENYGPIIRKFKEAPGGLNLIYFPKVEHDFTSSQGELGELVNYFFPYLRHSPILERHEGDSLSNLSTSIKSRQLFLALGFKGKIKPGFLRLANSTASSGVYVFEYFRLNLSRKKTLFKQIEAYLSHIPPGITFDEDIINEHISEPPLPAAKETIFPYLSKKNRTIGTYEYFEDLFMEEPSSPCPASINIERNMPLPKPEEKPAAAFFTPKKHDFYSKEYSIIENIKKDILELKKLGFYEHLVKEILEGIITEGYTGDMDSHLSRLVIDSDFNIYLPDYSSMEIKMTTLPKSLFLLFLLHPEGIILKQLSDYEPELMEIYKIISNRENYEDMAGSIKRMCNPTDKSVNEKLSRIRESFAREMASNYAGYYYVTGGRGEKKQIKLDRKLVSLPECFNSLIKMR